MNDTNLILFCILPMVVVAASVVFVMKAFFKDAQKRRNDEVTAERRNLTLNLRLQAYERITLFLERSAVQQLVMRLSLPGKAALQLQYEMLKTINEEFEHNFSQQIYLSTELWDLVKIAKESVIQQINSSAKTLDEQSSGEDLARVLLESEMSRNVDHLSKALTFLKKEVRLFF